MVYCGHNCVHLELTVKFFSKEKLQVNRYKGHKESVGGSSIFGN